MFPFYHIRSVVIGLGLVALIPMSAFSQRTYSTNFSLTENPVSEGGNWINGGVTGLDFSNVQTIRSLAFGTQSGTASGDSTYADSTAVLAGTWGPDQTVQATIAVTNASSASNVFEEVELRVRTTITAHSITGYEINCSVSTNSQNFYCQIVRWNGLLASFTILGGQSAHAKNGDIFKATINGSTITAYLNGVQIVQVTDSTYTTGSPGIGFFLQGASGLNANYGFSNFAATDSGSIQAPPATPPAPKNLRIIK
jgi:hypothetical protein